MGWEGKNKKALSHICTQSELRKPGLGFFFSSINLQAWTSSHSISFCLQPAWNMLLFLLKYGKLPLKLRKKRCIKYTASGMKGSVSVCLAENTE